MLVYTADKKQFSQDVRRNEIADKILTSFVRETGRSTGRSEIESWKNSMMFMRNIVEDSEIPDDAGIAIEYVIPATSKRIDFIITGLNNEERDTAILIELKQWQKAEKTNLDGIVRTVLGGGIRETSHPSYQVWSYATLLQDFNTNVRDNDIQLKPCAYLHNYELDDVIRDDFYAKYLSEAPLFLRNDTEKLTSFIKQYIKHGDKNNVMYQIENGKIRPSKQLADSIVEMLKGNKEFTLIDDQKLVYEKALSLSKAATDEVKEVLIVEGGPGTGKSVVAINLLVEITQRNQTVKYVTRNSAPRLVYEAMLTGSMTKSRISNMFSGSGSFTEVEANSIDTLVVDESHRLNEKSGLFAKGFNQVKEIIDAAKCSVFFIDEDQKVTFKDIGTKGEIKYWANETGANVTELQLASQFRCNGSDGYLAWLDNILSIKPTANKSLEGIDYDFRVIYSPEELHALITERNKENNKSRVVAGYTWDWISKNDTNLYDIEIGDYRARWNLSDDGQAWIIKPNSVKEVGCIHTCQGLELDYVGVIIGPDLVIHNGRVLTDGLQRAKTDKSLAGFKGMLKTDPEKAEKMADEIIKNTYRTLMTRGMKGCYIYCTDPETQQFFKEALKKIVDRNLFTSDDIGASITD